MPASSTPLAIAATAQGPNRATCRYPALAIGAVPIRGRAGGTGQDRPDDCHRRVESPPTARRWPPRSAGRAPGKRAAPAEAAENPVTRVVAQAQPQPPRSQLDTQPARRGGVLDGIATSSLATSS